MATVLVLLFLMFICSTIFAELYRIILFDDSNQTNLQNDVCYMKDIENENNRWCELVPVLPSMKTCISLNESLPILDDPTAISKWIDQSIEGTNCSYFLLSSMTKSQKRILTLVQSILLLILFLPFLFKLSLNIIQYCF